MDTEEMHNLVYLLTAFRSLRLVFKNFLKRVFLTFIFDSSMEINRYWILSHMSQFYGKLANSMISEDAEYFQSY